MKFKASATDRSILVIPWGEASESLFLALTRALGNRGGQIVVGISLNGVRRDLNPAAVIMDMPDELPPEGRKIIGKLQRLFPRVPTVVHTTSLQVREQVRRLREKGGRNLPVDTMYHPKEVALQPTPFKRLFGLALRRIAANQRRHQRKAFGVRQVNPKSPRAKSAMKRGPMPTSVGIGHCCPQ